MIAMEIPATPAAPGTPFQAPPDPFNPYQAPPAAATPFQAPPAAATPFEGPVAPFTPFQAPEELGYGYEPPLEEAAPPPEAGPWKQSTNALDDVSVKKLTTTVMILLLLVSVVMGLLLVFIVFTPTEESFVGGTSSSVPLEPHDELPHPPSKQVAPPPPASRRTTDGRAKAIEVFLENTHTQRRQCRTPNSVINVRRLDWSRVPGRTTRPDVVALGAMPRMLPMSRVGWTNLLRRVRSENTR
ncbi:hypothetical protein MTO96_022909 [Rhipicephalus appendiculatus]